MAKTKLQIEYDFDFCLIGIVCRDKDYRLCWFLNNVFSLKLVKTDDHTSATGFHSLFTWNDTETMREYFLLSNKGYAAPPVATNANDWEDYKPLVDEHKHTDFFLIIKGELTDKEMKNFSEQIMKLNIVTAAFQIEPGSLKSKHNLII